MKDSIVKMNGVFFTGVNGRLWSPEYPEASVMSWASACGVAAAYANGAEAIRNYGTDDETIFTPMMR